jgi:hypothetical protein
MAREKIPATEISNPFNDNSLMIARVRSLMIASIVTSRMKNICRTTSRGFARRRRRKFFQRNLTEATWFHNFCVL